MRNPSAAVEGPPAVEDPPVNDDPAGFDSPPTTEGGSDMEAEGREERDRMPLPRRRAAAAPQRLIAAARARSDVNGWEPMPGFITARLEPFRADGTRAGATEEGRAVEEISAAISRGIRLAGVAGSGSVAAGEKLDGGVRDWVRKNGKGRVLGAGDCDRSAASCISECPRVTAAWCSKLLMLM